MIRVHSGPEMILQLFVDWCKENQVNITYIEQGKPNQNAFIERFNCSNRTEVLEPHLFNELSQIRELSWARMMN